VTDTPGDARLLDALRSRVDQGRIAGSLPGGELLKEPIGGKLFFRAAKRRFCADP